MATVTDAYAAKGPRLLTACDFSPPRSGDPSFADAAVDLEADFICVAYSPGKSVRMDSAAAAATIKRHAKRDVIFNLATRDMNRLAMEMHLLGAQALGLENVLVLQGDHFSEKDLARLKHVGDFTPTGLVEAVRSMNEGIDFKGLKLASPTAFCVGATVDLSKGVEAEARLAHRKVEAGAQYLVTQSVYQAGDISDFNERYAGTAGEGIRVPVLYGVQVLVQDGLVFGNVPEQIKADLEKDRPGPEIALELIAALRGAGADAFYVIPPILKGGRRDYEAARQVLSELREAA